MLLRGDLLIPHLVQPHQGPRQKVWSGKFLSIEGQCESALFPDLVVSELLGQRVSAGLLHEVV